MNLPFVSIIILNYNGENFVGNCLDSLKEINYDKDSYEIIVVDNASKDNSVEIIKSYLPWIRFVETGRNLGYAGGNNAGVEVAKGNYLVFLNPDTIVEKNWLIELVKTIESDKTIGACSSKVLYQNDKNRINTIGGFWSILGLSGSLGENRETDSFTDGFYTFYPTGCSMIIYKNLYLSLGKFDDDYFLYCEDPDIGWKLWDNGYKVALAPNSLAYHLVSASLRGVSKKSYSDMFYFYNTRNGLITIVKNATKPDLLWMVPLYIFSWSVIATLFLVKGKFRSARSIIKGLIWSFTRILWLVEKRYNAHYKRTGKAKSMMTGVIESLKIFFGSKIEKHFI